MTKRALITGITGMVGSHLCDFLLEHTDWDVIGVCRWRSPLDNVEHLLDRVNRKDRVFFEYADLNDQMSLVRVVRKDDDLILRIKDDCVPFDPGERAKLSDPDDPTKNIGIRMVFGIAQDVQYQNILGLNVLMIRI